MDIFQANRKALELMGKHGLTSIGWKFNMDNAKRRFGVCKHRIKTISISVNLTQLNSEEQVTDTILHEIAHALVGPRQGHGPVWKAKAIEIGCKPERCYGSDVVRPKGNYVADCPDCKHVHIRIKKPKIGKQESCGLCSRTFNPKTVLSWRPAE